MTTTLNRDELATRLLALPAALEAAEEDLLQAQREATEAKCILEENEASLTLQGLDGKNEAERKASLYARTVLDRDRARQAGERVHQAALRVRVLQAEHSSLRAVARLLGGE